MKKIFYVVFIGFLLIACSVESKEEQIKEKEDSHSMTENKINEEEKYPEVLDELGVEHQLRLGEVDAEKTGQKLRDVYFTSDYSQVLDGHYYYMCSDNSGNHIVYKDNKEIVTQFTIEDGYVSSFLKCGNLFYAFLESDDEKKLNSLAYIDQESGEVTILKEMSKEIPMIGMDSPIVYEGFLFYEDRSTLVPNSFTGRLAKLCLNEGLEKEHFPLTSRLENLSPKPLLTLIDGKLYYGIQEEKKVTLLSFDLESNSEKEVFCYERKDEIAGNEIILQMDNDYIYCQDYIIPREGDRMKRILKNRAEGVPVSYNNDYIFYIDNEYHLHQINKETYKDVLICGKMKVESVDCVADGIYVRGCSEAIDKLNDDDSDIIAARYSSKNLFYMDINGENRERLCREFIFTVDL